MFLYTSNKLFEEEIKGKNPICNSIKKYLGIGWDQDGRGVEAEFTTVHRNIEIHLQVERFTQNTY